MGYSDMEIVAALFVQSTTLDNLDPELAELLQRVRDSLSEGLDELQFELYEKYGRPEWIVEYWGAA